MPTRRLHLPDFRAAEHTFQLVTQVAGRTGRGERGGRVVVQTFSPDHPAIRAAVHHDYAMFARQELPIREALLYPPFAEMIRIVVRGPVEAPVHEFAKELGRHFARELKQIDTPSRFSAPLRPRSPNCAACIVIICSFRPSTEPSCGRWCAK